MTLALVFRISQTIKQYEHIVDVADKKYMDIGNLKQRLILQNTVKYIFRRRGALTLCILMDYPIHIDTSLGLSIVYLKGHR